MKTYRPTSPSKRHHTTVTYRNVLTKGTPEKSLTKGFKRSVGRNNQGRITTRHKGGGHKRLYREIDFMYNKHDIPAKITSIEYDPNRNAFISLVCYKDGEKRYIISPEGLKVGDVIVSADKEKIKLGNSMKIKNIPVGTIIHNIEMEPKKGAQIARSAGTFAQISGFENGKTILKMPSGEIRYINEECFATIGQVGNLDHNQIVIGKAGRNRWLGKRPHVRGTAMNPVDHPHGGGEGKTKGGRHPVSPWGQPAKGYKTRNKRKPSKSQILRKRKK